MKNLATAKGVEILREQFAKSGWREWMDGDKRFQCPKHHSKYTAEGVYIEGRATRSMDRFAVQKTGNTVVADLDKLYEEDQDGPLWKAAYVTL